MMKTPSVLVVDDEPDNFDVIEALLTQQNYQLHYVTNGPDAIAYLDSFQPDLILLDVMMPDMDGMEVCQKIKSLPQWSVVPIIMVTALNSKSDLARCLATGADDFISKPINALELRARVHSMLRIKQQYDNIQSLYQVQKGTANMLESTLNALNGNLASTLAHELNTPLNGILGTVDFLWSSIDTLPITEIKEMLGWVNESAHRLSRLTKKFRTYLELELATQPSSSSKTGPKSVSEYTSFSRPFVQTHIVAQADKVDRRADIKLTMEETTVRLSEYYTSTILHELTDNALKFSDPGTPIQITGQVEGKILKLSFHDYGRGMTDEQISKIGAFIQFERNTYEQQGTGMGLKIVQKIVEIAEGEFSIQSIYQQETTINVSLPLVCNDTLT